MVKSVKYIKLSVLSGICGIVAAACTPSHHMPTDNQLGYGYDNAAYGYDYVSGQSSYDYGYGHEQNGYAYGQSQDFASAYGMQYANSAQHSTRYGELRGPCDTAINHCGFMTVVPVYPVFQIVTYPQVAQPVETYVPEVEIFETPTITLPEAIPEPIIISQPEMPMYEPAPTYWPEPDTPVTTWTPKRK